MQVGLKWLTLSCAMLAVHCSSISLLSANHPFHVSTAEVEYNAKTKRIEVGLKCQTADLERALRLMVGKKIDIENDPQVDELITRYVTENFYLANAPTTKETDKPSSDSVKTAPSNSTQELPAPPKESIKFSGKEFETKWIWIYFELQPPEGVDKLVLINRVLFEVNTGQINTCLIRHNGQRYALKSTASKPMQDYDRKWFEPATQKE